jgi:hypothetical protein
MSTQPNGEFGGFKSAEERAAFEKIKQDSIREFIANGGEDGIHHDLEDSIPMDKVIEELEEIERLEKLKRG